MRSKKINVNNYEILIKKTKKYSTIALEFLFEMSHTRENILLSDLLAEYMIYANLKYKTREEINKKMLELYSIGFSLNSFNIGEKLFIEIRATLYDPELVKDDYFKDALEFIHDMIFSPKFENGVLDSVELNLAKTTLVERVKYALSDNMGQIYMNILENFYPNTYEDIEIINSENEFQKELDKLTDKKIINFHKKLLNSLVSLTMMGNIKDNYIDLIGNIFKFKNVVPLDTNYNDSLYINKETPFYIKMSNPNYKESVLSLFYNAPISNNKDQCINLVIARMLNTGGMILHKVLREELKLVYRTSCSYDFRHNNIMLRAHLDKQNEQKVLDGFEYAIDKLKNKELLTNLLIKIKEELELADYVYDEDKNNVWAGLLNEHYNFHISWEKKLKIIKSLTADDILKGIDKLEKIKIHFFEGVA